MEPTPTQNKKTSLCIQIVIYAIVFIALTRNCISLVLAGIAQAFPDADTTAVQSIYSVISTGGIIGSLLAGKLAQIFYKKYILIVDLLLGCAAGLYAYFFGTSIAALRICSVLIGVVFGQFVPLTGALIAEYFSGNDRSGVVGLRVVFMNCGGIVVTLLAGQLAKNYWKNAYLMFLLCVPVALIALFLLPKGSIERTAEATHGEKTGFVKKYLNKWLVMLLVAVLVQGIGYFCYLSNVSFTVNELGLGGTSQASYVSTIMQLACIATGFIMIPSVSLLKRCVPGVGLVGMALSFVVLATAKGYAMLILAAVIFGYSVTLFSNGTVAIMPENIPSGSMTMSMALFNSLMSIGMTIAPYVVTKPASMINSSTAVRYWIAAALLLLGGLFALTVLRKNTKEVTAKSK